MTDTQVIQAFDRLAQAWNLVSYQTTNRSVQAIALATGLNTLQVQLGLRFAFEELTAPKVARFWDEQSPREVMARKIVLIIAAGNVFTAWLPVAAQALLMGHAVWIKPSSDDPVFPKMWQASMRQVSPELGERVEVVAWSEDLFQKVDKVVAFGKDETLEKLRAQLPAEKTFVGYGHKFSVSVVQSTDEPDKFRQALFDSIVPFQLQGCLSPKICFVQKGIHLDSFLPKDVPLPEIRPFKQLHEIQRFYDENAKFVSSIGYWHSQLHLKADASVRICRLDLMQKPRLGWKNGGIDLWEKLSS